MKTFIPLTLITATLAWNGGATSHAQSVTTDTVTVRSSSAVPSAAPEPPEPPAPNDPVAPGVAPVPAPAPGYPAPVVQEDMRLAQIDAQEQMAKAQAELKTLKNQLYWSDAGSSRMLVLRSGDTDPKSQANLQEDMAVMAHILEKAVAEDANGQPMVRSAAGINILFAPGPNNSLQNMYLDGYGALFMLQVNFPLFAPPAEPGPAKPAQPTNSAWEEARNELYGQPGDGNKENWSADQAGGPEQEYDEDKVNDLKSTLLDSLKNAANIRGMKSDDWITICVMGSSSGREPRGKRFVTRTIGGNGGGGGYNSGLASPDVFGRQPMTKFKTFTLGPGRQTVMMLRVKKSDVDAYAKGDLDAAKFQKKVSITTYMNGEDQEQ